MMESTQAQKNRAAAFAQEQTLEEKQNARRGARNTIKETPGERVTNELLPF